MRGCCGKNESNGEVIVKKSAFSSNKEIFGNRKRK